MCTIYISRDVPVSLYEIAPERRLQDLQEQQESGEEERRVSVVNFRTGTYLREDSYDLLNADYFMNFLSSRPTFSFRQPPSRPRSRFLRQSSSSPSSGLSVPSCSREMLVSDDYGSLDFTGYEVEFLELRDMEHQDQLERSNRLSDDDVKQLPENGEFKPDNGGLRPENGGPRSLPDGTGVKHESFFDVVSVATRQATLEGSTLFLNLAAVKEDSDEKPVRAKGYIRKGLRDRLAQKAEEARKNTLKRTKEQYNYNCESDFTVNAMTVSGTEDSLVCEHV